VSRTGLVSPFGSLALQLKSVAPPWAIESWMLVTVNQKTANCGS